MAVKLKMLCVCKIKIHKHTYIGYSGGIDSGVLLDSCCRELSEKYILKAVHINHSYNKASLRWNKFCKNICNIYRIALYTYTVKNETYKSNLEQIFRSFRFKFFLKLIKKNSTLLLAHHANDLMETVLMRIFRGVGSLDVGGVKYKSKIGHINVVRPLLNLRKQHIVDYMVFNQLVNISDFFNFNIKFSRTYFRTYINQFFYSGILYEHLIIRYMFLNFNIFNYVNKYVLLFFNTYGLRYKSLFIPYIVDISLFLINEVIRKWISFNNYKLPMYSNLKEIIKLIRSRGNKNSYVNIDIYVVEKFNDYLYIKRRVKKRIMVYKNFFLIYFCKIRFIYIIYSYNYFMFKFNNAVISSIL